MIREYHSQHKLISMLMSCGPLTVRQMAQIVYGDDSREHRKRMGGRVLKANAAGYVEFCGFADRPGQQRGLWPAKWRAKVTA